MTVRVGDCGVALTALRPQGFVRLHGRRFDARSEFEIVEAGSTVQVVSGDLHGLLVRKVGPNQADEHLPDYGKPVRTSFVEVVAEQEKQRLAEHEEWQAEKPRWRAARRAYARRRGAILGALFAAGGLCLSWENLCTACQSPWLAALGIEAFAIFWGVVVILTLDRSQQKLLGSTLRHIEERSYDLITLTSTTLALLGSAGGALLGIPALGLGPGLLTALLGTVVLGFLTPGILALHAGGEG